MVVCVYNVSMDRLGMYKTKLAAAAQDTNGMELIARYPTHAQLEEFGTLNINNVYVHKIIIGLGILASKSYNVQVANTSTAQFQNVRAYQVGNGMEKNVNSATMATLGMLPPFNVHVQSAQFKIKMAANLSSNVLVANSGIKTAGVANVHMDQFGTEYTVLLMHALMEEDGIKHSKPVNVLIIKCGSINHVSLHKLYALTVECGTSISMHVSALNQLMQLLQLVSRFQFA